jgi:hypothetical protein
MPGKSCISRCAKISILAPNDFRRLRAGVANFEAAKAPKNPNITGDQGAAGKRIHQNQLHSPIFKGFHQVL